MGATLLQIAMKGNAMLPHQAFCSFSGLQRPYIITKSLVTREVSACMKAWPYMQRHCTLSRQASVAVAEESLMMPSDLAQVLLSIEAGCMRCDMQAALCCIQSKS